jgi:hypothetical protein
VQPASTIIVSLAPAASNVPAGGSLVFTATVSGAGSASSAIAFTVGGIAGGNTILGTIVTTASSATATTALYTAPVAPPTPANVTVTAASIADSSKSASATVTIVCSAANSIAPTSISLALTQTQSFSASFCGGGSTTINWDVNGVSNGNSALGTITVTGAGTALYTAPASLPSTNPLTIRASINPSSGSAESVSASVTIASGVGISISPPSATVATRQRATFAAAVSNTSDVSVSWFVNGISNGNSSIGQVCQTGSNPCLLPAVPAVGSVDYLAPATAPASQPISLTAVSHADDSRSATASISITASSTPISVSISPPYAFIAASAGSSSTQQFFASVAGTTNQGVTWSVASAVSGAGCGGAACGSITSSGIYTAPALAPSPNAVSVIATSQADPTKSASATLALTSGPVIEEILPSSAMAGVVQSIALSVTGANFVAGSGSSASVIFIQGAARATTCSSTSMCTTALSPTDVQSPGTLTIQITNPGPPAAVSNPVPFVILPFDVSQGIIALTSAQPGAPGADIVVVEPTIAAASSPFSVNSVGLFTSGNTCGIQGSPLTVTRPASGSAVASICVNGTGLDASFTYTFTSPQTNPGDIVVTASNLTGFLPNTIELDLQISSGTTPGLRSLFITTINNDRAVATGVLEIQ